MRFKKLLLLLLICLVATPLAFAGLKSGRTTTAYTDVSCSAGIDCSVSDGVLALATDGDSAGSFSSLTVDNVTLNSDLISGLKASTEVLNVSLDTLTAAQTGLTQIITTNATITLPAAAAGLEFSFIGGNGVTFSVDPASTADTIDYLAMSAGDKITSPAQTGDSLTLISGAAGSWKVKNRINSFTDGN